MSQSRVKKIRKTVYGDYSPKFRKYKRLPNGSLTGQIIADDRRRDYQKAKVATFHGGGGDAMV